MIESISHRLAIKIHASTSESNVSIDIMAYAIGYYINFFGVIAVSVIVGWISGELTDTVIAMVGFGVLRMITGGAHFRSLTTCAIVTIALMCAIAHTPISEKYDIIVTCIAISIIFIRAPKFRNKAISPKEAFCRKTAAILIVGANLIIMSQPLALAYLAQAVTLLFIGGEQE